MTRPTPDILREVAAHVHIPSYQAAMEGAIMLAEVGFRVARHGSSIVILHPDMRPMIYDGGKLMTLDAAEAAEA